MTACHETIIYLVYSGQYTDHKQTSPKNLRTMSSTLKLITDTRIRVGRLIQKDYGGCR